MKAYAVLSGGGVKGAALAGCVNAARHAGVEFVGFGGTSAGSIVALLASIGYLDDELKRIAIDEMPFHTLLDDEGRSLDKVRKQVDALLKEGRWWDLDFGIPKLWILWSLGRYAKNLGLYDGQRLRNFLLEKIRCRMPTLERNAHISFQDLEDNGGQLLKVVATDLRRREPAIFQQVCRWGSSVIDAVRASTAYPFVFKPHCVDDTKLVDGGLASNAPVFLFREEYRQTRYPTLVFDVGVSPDVQSGNHELNRFVRDLLSAALEASDSALRQTVPGFTYIKVTLTEQLDALDFKVDRKQREALYLQGYEAANRFLASYPPLRLAHKASDRKKELQAVYGPPLLFQPILEAIALECERVSAAKDVRVTIMLPTMHTDGSRIVVYDYNMDGDPDQALTLGEDAGCSGRALKAPEGVMMADLEESRRHPEAWGMKPEEAAQVPPDRKAILSVAIPVLRTVSDMAKRESWEKAKRIGVLSIDSIDTLSESRWTDAGTAAELVPRLAHWATILGRLLSE